MSSSAQKSGTRPVFTAVAIATIIAATLTACGGGGGGDTPTPADPLKKYREQSVVWTECDPSIVGVTDAKFDELRAQAGDRLRCTLVRAPLDWSNPERGDVVLSMMRLAAATPERRRGALLFNPGGPGEDGLKFSLKLFKAFSQSNPDSPQGALQLRLLNEYDAVGFSPRGLGASTQLQCATNEVTRQLDTSAAHWDTPENINNAHYNGRKIAEACLKNPITPYINTDATARDMDLMRGLLGEEKLNYVGYSYGTWLGAWYASLFPEKVGRMVLDSSTDFSTTLEQAVLNGQPPARQHLLDNILAPYAARHAAYFQLGTSVEQVRTVVSNLSPRVQQLLAGHLAKLGYKSDDADQYLGTISAARGLDEVLKNANDPTDMDAVKSALQQYVFDPSNQELNSAIHGAAEDILESYISTWITPQTHSIALGASASVLMSVHCNDTPAITDLSAWLNWIRGLAQRAPLFAPSDIEVHACAFWGGPKVSKPALTPLKQMDILFVQSQNDAATYTEGANNFFAQLPTARRVFVADDYQHGIYPYADSCVDPIVTRYLLGESPSQRETICQGHPLEQDKAPTIALQGASLKQGRAATVSDKEPPSTYKDPAKAKELINEFKRGLIPPNLRP